MKSNRIFQVGEKVGCFFLLFPLMFSCSSNDEWEETSHVPAVEQLFLTVPDTSGVVTTETIEKVARTYQPEGIGTRSASTKEIGSIQTIMSEEGTPQLYVVNYANQQGFIIISATQNYMPVLAFSDHGYFDIEQAKDSGVSVWMDQQQFYVDASEEFPDSLKLKYQSMWMKYTNKQVPMATTRGDMADITEFIGDQFYKWQAEGYTVYSLYDYKRTPEFRSLPQDVQNALIENANRHANPNYGDKEQVSFVLRKDIGYAKEVTPLLDTKWGQEDGYNKFIPNQFPVGCTAVALGQIMKYHEFPVSFNWAEMDNNKANDANAQYLLNVGRMIGLIYEVGDSGADTGEVLAALHKFGYTDAIKCEHDETKVLSELLANRPVYMRGRDGILFNAKGHAWVCDGVIFVSQTKQIKLMTLEDCPSNITPVRFTNFYNQENYISSARYHMNWGFYGICDAFYYDDNIKIQLGDEDRNYNRGREEIIHIYPIND